MGKIAIADLNDVPRPAENGSSGANQDRKADDSITILIANFTSPIKFVRQGKPD